MMDGDLNNSSDFYISPVISPLMLTVAIWVYSYKASCARPG